MKRRKVVEAAVVLALSGLALMLAPPASGQEAPRAIVNGLAVAAGVDVPAAVTPNVEVAPVFSFSGLNNGGSHGISAGFWPGDILHAFADVYGYGDPARSMMGIAESLWPDRPTDRASTSDFGDKCRFMALLTPHGVPKEDTDFFTSGCYTFWEYTHSYYPYQAATAESSSTALSTNGSADGLKMVLPSGVEIAEVHSTSATKVAGGKTISDSTLVYRDVRIGDLTIKMIRSVAHAESNGKAGGVKASRRLQIVDAFVNGSPVMIGEEGVTAVEDAQKSAEFKGIQSELAKNGFDVRLIQGSSTTGTHQADAVSGGLLIRTVQKGASPDDIDPACAQLFNAYPQPLATVGPFDLGQNPLYKDVFPENQLPDRVAVNSVVPPPFLCPLKELERTADVAVILGSTVAQARFIPLPKITLGNEGGPPSLPRVITRTITYPGSGGTGPAPVSPDPATPGEPKAQSPVAVVDPLQGAAAKVKLLYGVIGALLGVMVIGRSTFRNLIRM